MAVLLVGLVAFETLSIRFFSSSVVLSMVFFLVAVFWALSTKLPNTFCVESVAHESFFAALVPFVSAALFTINGEERRFFCELFSTWGSPPPPRDAGFLFSSCDSFISSKSFEFPARVGSFLLTEEKNDFRDFCTAIVVGVLDDDAAAAELFPPPPDDGSMAFRSVFATLSLSLAFSFSQSSIQSEEWIWNFEK